MRKQNILLLLWAFIMPNLILAQDPLFSSTLDNPLYYNPASPGLILGNEFRLNYREQWPSLPSEMRSFIYASTHQIKNVLGLGFLAMSNNEGESKLRNDQVSLSIAFPITLSRLVKISAGISTGFGQKTIDWSRVEFDDQYDKYYGKIYNTSFPFPSQFQQKYGDMSIGLAAKGALNRGRNETQIFGTLGVAMKHAAVFPNANFIGSDIRAVPLNYIVHANVWILHKGLKKGIAPNFTYEQQARMTTINISTVIVAKPAYFIVGFRNRNYKFNPERFDSFIFGLGYTTPIKNDNVSRLGYTYDFTTSKLLGGTYGSHEIHWSASFDVYGSRDLNTKRKRKAKHDFHCPSFNW